MPEGDDEGGALLPSVSLGIDDGPDVPPPPTASCEPLRDLPTVTDAAKTLSLPTSSTAPPSDGSWVRSTSRPQKTTTPAGDVRTGNPVFANFDNEYLRLVTTRAAGDVVAIHMKAPTFPDTRNAATMPSAELRYFSICTNDLPTTRYVACIADQDTLIDPLGNATFVVSDLAHKPNNLRSTDNWVSNGPYADYFILYRHMLPADDFAGAIQRIPGGNNATDAEIRASMGDYYPVAKICSKEQFEIDRCGIPE